MTTIHPRGVYESACVRTVSGLFCLTMTEQGDPLGTSATVPQPSSRAATKEACTGSRRAPRHRGGRSEIGSRARGSRAQRRRQSLNELDLSTRAFYRHFDSKDQLVAAVFLEMTRTEVRRLRTRMEQATNPIEAVAAWIDGRLDLAFDEDIKAELRQISLEAQSKVFSLPRDGRARIRCDPGAARRAARARPRSRRVQRHRSDDRGQVDTRRGVGRHPAAVGNESLGPPRSPRTRGAVLLARVGRGAPHDRPTHRGSRELGAKLR